MDSEYNYIQSIPAMASAAAGMLCIVRKGFGSLQKGKMKDLDVLLQRIAHGVESSAALAAVTGNKNIGVVHHIFVPMHHALGSIFVLQDGYSVTCCDKAVISFFLYHRPAA